MESAASETWGGEQSGRKGQYRSATTAGASNTAATRRPWQGRQVWLGTGYGGRIPIGRAHGVPTTVCGTDLKALVAFIAWFIEAGTNAYRPHAGRRAVHVTRGSGSLCHGLAGGENKGGRREHNRLPHAGFPLDAPATCTMAGACRPLVLVKRSNESPSFHGRMINHISRMLRNQSEVLPRRLATRELALESFATRLESRSAAQPPVLNLAEARHWRSSSPFD